MRKPKRSQWQCSVPECQRNVPYTDWTTCEDHNPYSRLFGDSGSRSNANPSTPSEQDSDTGAVSRSGTKDPT